MNTLGPEGVRYSETFVIVNPLENTLCEKNLGDNYPFLSQLHVLLLLLWRSLC